MQSLLEPLHTHHVLGELEGLAVGLDGELSVNKETRLSSAKDDNLLSVPGDGKGAELTRSHSAASPGR